MKGKRHSAKQAHMSVAEVKRHFADVVGRVAHGGERIIVERRGHPVVAIVAVEEAREARHPGQRLAAAIGCGDRHGEGFRELMAGVVARRGRRPPRQLPEHSE